MGETPAEVPVKLQDLKPGMLIPAQPLRIVATSWTEAGVKAELSDGSVIEGAFTDAVYVIEPSTKAG